MAKSILTRDMIKAISSAISEGLSVIDTVNLIGISESAYYNWEQRGQAEICRLAKSDRAKPKEREALYLEFVEAVKKAKPQRKIHHIRNIRKAADGGTWQASAWLLERMHPDEFGRKDQIKHGGMEGGEPIRIIRENRASSD